MFSDCNPSLLLSLSLSCGQYRVTFKLFHPMTGNATEESNFRPEVIRNLGKYVRAMQVGGQRKLWDGVIHQ